jgi:hypothetical protein
MVMGGGKRWGLWIAVVVLLAACAGGSAAPASPAMSAAVIRCSLPVYRWGGVTNGGNYSIVGQYGFLNLASGKFAADPKFTSVDGYYDWRSRRWLPVPMAQVLPDGSAYVYEKELTDSYEIHLVQVASGADRVVFHMPYDNAYQILAFQPEGIYVYPIVHRSGLTAGLWLLDPATAALKPLPASMDGTWQLVSGGAAWGGPGGVAGDSLVRLDLATGISTRWFQHTVQGAVFEGMGYGVSVIGFDGSGRPLVEVFPPFDLQASPAPNPQPEVWLVSSPGQASRVLGLPVPLQGGVATGVSDSHGMWVEGRDGVYLYANGAFRKVAPLPAAPENNYMLAGACG